MTDLERLLAIAARRDRPADAVWPAAAAAIELLWWHDRFDDAHQLAESVLVDFAEQPTKLYQCQLPFTDALLASAEWRGDDPVPALTAVLRCVPVDTVLGRQLAWMLAERPRRRPFELLSGHYWGYAPLPLKRHDQELADRPPQDLTDAERERLYSAAHNRHRFDAAERLLAETGCSPNRWYVAVWMAGELTQQGRTEVATSLLLDALPGWIPFEAWDVMPTDVVLQPPVRPAVNNEVLERVLASVDISRVPGASWAVS